MKRPDAIRAMLYANGIDCQKLQKILSITEKTAYRKLKEPYAWTTKDLAQLRQAGVPVRDITEALRQIM